MCTSITFKANDFYFGRNMDLDYHFGEGVVITSRNYPFTFKHEKAIATHYAIIGMATLRDGYPLYADGVNEKGLCVSAQNFPGNAYYENKPNEKMLNLASYEIIPYILSNFATVSEAEKGLKELCIVNTPFDKSTPTSPLHWMIADENEAITLEATREGVNIYKNQIGILTNNPPFPLQLKILENYSYLTVKIPSEGKSSLGLDLQGLPGDFSSSSRFVKIATLKKYVTPPADGDATVSALFRLMYSVAPIKGVVLTTQGAEHYTTYTCVINATKGIYYYSSSESLNVKSVSFDSTNLDSSELLNYPY